MISSQDTENIWLGRNDRTWLVGIRNEKSCILGISLDQLVVWESWLQTLQTWSRSLPHVSLWLSTNQNPELRNFLSVRPPQYGKNKLLLNEYSGDFMHFESLFFVEIGQWCWLPMMGVGGSSGGGLQ